MQSIQIFMNYYRASKQYVILILFNDAEHSFEMHEPKNRRDALKLLSGLEKQHNVKGVINA